MMGKNENVRARFELSGILEQYGAEFIEKHNLCSNQLKAIKDIIECRTEKKKGHLSKCDHCGHIEQSYNSCRNRHCNKCQFIKQTMWADKLKGRLLPEKYFHVVFTVPEGLNGLFYINQQQCYDMLFKTAWSVLSDVCRNPRFLGASTGAVAVLHTWSSTLGFHPHVHMLVPAGGLTEDGIEWIRSKDKFLVPVKLLSKIFRARCADTLKCMIENNQMITPGGTSWGTVKESIYRKHWVVYAKKTGKTVDRAIEYLARYTNRVAIGNNRIVNVEDDKVTFRYKDPKTGRYNREMALGADEFIRRFMQHILPSGFYKIRYFGILSAINTNTLREQCLGLIGKQLLLPQFVGLNAYEVLWSIIGSGPSICKKCKTGRMVLSVHENPG
jgi:hypothetical protein